MITRSVRNPHGWLLPAAVAGALVLGQALVATAQSPAASAGASGDVHIALVLNDLTNPVSRPLRKGAEDAAAEHGFQLTIVGPNPSTAQAQIALLQDMQTQGVDGI